MDQAAYDAALAAWRQAEQERIDRLNALEQARLARATQEAERRLRQQQEEQREEEAARIRQVEREESQRRIREDDQRRERLSREHTEELLRESRGTPRVWELPINKAISLNNATAVAHDPQGKGFVVADSAQVWRVSSSLHQQPQLVAGNGVVGPLAPSGSVATDVPIDPTGDVHCDREGNVFIVEARWASRQVRMIRRDDGLIRTISQQLDHIPVGMGPPVHQGIRIHGTQEWIAPSPSRMTRVFDQVVFFQVEGRSFWRLIHADAANEWTIQAVQRAPGEPSRWHYNDPRNVIDADPQELIQSNGHLRRLASGNPLNEANLASGDVLTTAFLESLSGMNLNSGFPGCILDGGFVLTRPNSSSVWLIGCDAVRDENLMAMINFAVAQAPMNRDHTLEVVQSLRRIASGENQAQRILGRLARHRQIAGIAFGLDLLRMIYNRAGHDRPTRAIFAFQAQSALVMLTARLGDLNTYAGAGSGNPWKG